LTGPARFRLDEIAASPVFFLPRQVARDVHIFVKDARDFDGVPANSAGASRIVSCLGKCLLGQIVQIIGEIIDTLELLKPAIIEISETNASGLMQGLQLGGIARLASFHET
jgi:hypothetical protein